MKPYLETLEDRLALSTVDLTTVGAEGSINGALFQQCDAQPTGTGYIRSFVRVQGANANASIEQGYNTDARPLELDENKSPQFTRSLTLGQVPLSSHGGVLHREFLLDINQSSSRPLLSLDELRMYVGDQPNLKGYNPTTHELAGLTPVYDMDAGGDNWVKLNYRLNSGSGSGDVFVNVSASLFGSDGSKYVYVYSKFGVNHGVNAGFEEWAVRTTPGDNNPAGTSSLAGRVFRDDNNNGIQDNAEAGIAGVIIQLQGVNDRGENVVLTATTNAEGQYKFSNLRAGIYSLLEVQPDGYEDGIDTIGTQGGSWENDRFFDIFLAAGVDGEENNFAELLLAGS